MSELVIQYTSSILLVICHLLSILIIKYYASRTRRLCLNKDSITVPILKNKYEYICYKTHLENTYGSRKWTHRESVHHHHSSPSSFRPILSLQHAPLINYNPQDPELNPSPQIPNLNSSSIYYNIINNINIVYNYIHKKYQSYSF